MADPTNSRTKCLHRLMVGRDPQLICEGSFINISFVRRQEPVRGLVSNNAGEQIICFPGLLISLFVFKGNTRET